MRSNFFLKSKIDAVSCISGLKRLKSRAAWYVSFCFAQFVISIGTLYNREHLGKLLRIVSFDLRISTKSQENETRVLRRDY